MQEKQRVAVFGGAGYLGSCLVRHLLSNNFTVRVFDCFTFGKFGIAEISSPDLEVIEGSICDINAVSAALEDAEVVVLLSAVVGKRAEDTNFFNMRNVNFLAASVVLDAAIEHGARRFIFASTDSVYGLQKGVMYETTTPEPVTLYARLKLRMEERVINSKKRLFHPTVLRVANCYGYSPRMRFDLVANALIRDAVCKKEINVSNGEQWRAFVHVDDASRAFLAAIKAHENLVSGEIFNVGSKNQNLDIAHLVNVIKSIVPEATINSLESTGDAFEYFISCTKIEKVLDFQARRTLEESLTELKNMLLKNEFSDPYSLKYQNV